MGAKMTDAQISNYAIDTDWRKVFRPAITQSHDLAIESGGKILTRILQLVIWTMKVF